MGKKTAQGKTPAKLLVAMTGKASAAKTAKGAGLYCEFDFECAVSRITRDLAAL